MNIMNQRGLGVMDRPGLGVTSSESYQKMQWRTIALAHHWSIEFYRHVQGRMISQLHPCIRQAARKMDAPIMIQFSAGGAQFYAGKGLDTRLTSVFNDGFFLSCAQN